MIDQKANRKIISVRGAILKLYIFLKLLNKSIFSAFHVNVSVIKFKILPFLFFFSYTNTSRRETITNILKSYPSPIKAQAFFGLLPHT